jgi:hypothetical protein
MRERYFSTHAVSENANKALIKACQRPGMLVFGVAAAAALHGTYNYIRESKRESQELNIRPSISRVGSP